MLNIEKYEEEIIKVMGTARTDDVLRTFVALKKGIDYGDISYKEAMEWLLSEYKEPIPDDEEPILERQRREKMLNIEKYKDFVLENLNRCKLKSSLRREGVKIACCKNVSCTECKERCFKWLMEEYKEPPILDNVEKAYLSAVIKPFRNRIRFIVKIRYKFLEQEFIYISVEGNSITFPPFKLGTKYKGMKDRKNYTLEELGL